MVFWGISNKNEPRISCACSIIDDGESFVITVTLNYSFGNLEAVDDDGDYMKIIYVLK